MELERQLPHVVRGRRGRRTKKVADELAREGAERNDVDSVKIRLGVVWAVRGWILKQPHNGHRQDGDEQSGKRTRTVSGATRAAEMADSSIDKGVDAHMV